MLSKLGSVIGNLFTPLKVKEIGGGPQSNKLSDVRDENQRHSKQNPKKDSEPKPEQQKSGQQNDPEPGFSNHPASSPVTAEPTFGLAKPVIGPEASKVDADEKTKQDELTRKNQDIGLSSVWVEMKDKLSADSQPRALQANDAYEAGLKKKRSLLKNSKGGMVDKKAA